MCRAQKRGDPGRSEGHEHLWVHKTFETSLMYVKTIKHIHKGKHIKICDMKPKQ